MASKARDDIRKRQNIYQALPQSTTDALPPGFRSPDSSIPPLVEPYAGAEHNFSKIRTHNADRSVSSSAHHECSSPGQPLDAATLDFMEPRFGHDFSKVRIHAEGRDAVAARDVNATAYTVGHDIVFDNGQYMPETDTGKRLLAHELTHVVQQSRGGTSTPPPLPTHPLEQAAQRAASIVASGGTVHVAGASAPGIARQPRSLNESLDPGSMSDADLQQEIALIRQWLDENPANSPEHEQLTASLSTMEAEVMRRNGQQNQAQDDQGQQQADGGAQGDSAPLSGSGPTLSSGEQPASFQFGGLPAFRYNAPPVPIATAHVETPTASFDLSLILRGSLTVIFQHSATGVSTDVDQMAFRAEASNSVNGLLSGIRINGIGSERVSFGATLGTEFSQAEVRFIKDGTIALIGQMRIAYTRDTPIGPVTMLGQPGFELQITATPHFPLPPPEPIDEESWFSRHATELAFIGATALMITAVALAPETAGGSLVLLEVAKDLTVAEAGLVVAPAL